MRNLLLLRIRRILELGHLRDIRRAKMRSYWTSPIMEHLTLKTVLVGLSVLVASIGFATGRASAETITLSNLGTVPPTTDGVLLGPGVFLTGSNNAPQSTGADASDPSGWDPWGSADTTSQWLSVGGCCGGSGSFATFSFAETNVFTLLWGSPNSDNTITLYSGTNGTGSSLAYNFVRRRLRLLCRWHFDDNDLRREHYGAGRYHLNRTRPNFSKAPY